MKNKYWKGYCSKCVLKFHLNIWETKYCPIKATTCDSRSSTVHQPWGDLRCRNYLEVMIKLCVFRHVSKETDSANRWDGYKVGGSMNPFIPAQREKVVSEGSPKITCLVSGQWRYDGGLTGERWMGRGHRAKCRCLGRGHLRTDFQ